MGFPFAFVHSCYGLARDTHLVEGVDVEPAVPVADPEQVLVFLVDT